MSRVLVVDDEPALAAGARHQPARRRLGGRDGDGRRSARSPPRPTATPTSSFSTSGSRTWTAPR